MGPKDWNFTITGTVVDYNNATVFEPARFRDDKFVYYILLV